MKKTTVRRHLRKIGNKIVPVRRHKRKLNRMKNDLSSGNERWINEDELVKEIANIFGVLDGSNAGDKEFWDKKQEFWKRKIHDYKSRKTVSGKKIWDELMPKARKLLKEEGEEVGYRYNENIFSPIKKV